MPSGPCASPQPPPGSPAPKGTRTPVNDKINGEVRQVLADPKVKQNLDVARSYP